MTVPFPPPPVPEAIEQLRETVEVQNRTIRYLLQNYENLLRKIESEADLVITWSQGAAQTIAANAVIPTGLWVNGPNSISLWHTSHSYSHSIDAYDLFFTDGNDIKNGTSQITIFPLTGSL